MSYEPEFARVYDFITAGAEEKLATETELDFIRAVFKNSPIKIKEILDIGCGKGRFLIPLAQASYHLTGLDQSPDMLADCLARLEKRNLQAELILADFEEFDFNKNFDAVICMDSVICYLLETERIISALAKFRQTLRPQGIFILDMWNILGQYELLGKITPHKFESDEIRIEWSEDYRYEDFASVFRGIYCGTFTENGVTKDFSREEILRAMTAGEVKMYLKEAGFSDVEVYGDYQFAPKKPLNAEALIFTAINR